MRVKLGMHVGEVKKPDVLWSRRGFQKGMHPSPCQKKGCRRGKKQPD
jgi:hypothetical protein